MLDTINKFYLKAKGIQTSETCSSPQLHGVISSRVYNNPKFAGIITIKIIQLAYQAVFEFMRFKLSQGHIPAETYRVTFEHNLFVVNVIP